ncbi:MAG: host specificity factor TipJ family phage tail protein [Acidimicrobiia bacterium]|nr:host specificity factor TipJ family phage tail protein [Acidimicrobiia bacterium]
MKDITNTSVRVLAKPNPFKEEVLEAHIAPGMSLREILGNDSNHFLISLNGEMVPCEEWNLTFPSDDDIVLITRLPQGDFGKDLLRIIAVIVVIWFAWWAAPYLAAYFGGTIAFWQSALMFAGVVLVNVLLPPELPKIDQGERKRLNSLTGTRNSFAPFATIPNLYGEHRLYPPYASVPYTEIVGEDQYFNGIFCVGLGEYKIDGNSIKIGETPVTQYEDVEIRQTDQPAQVDIFEEQLNVRLDQTAEPGESGTRTTQANTDQIGLDFLMPSGLIQIDSDDGDKHFIRIHLLIEFRESGTMDPWVSMTTTDWGNTTRGTNEIITNDGLGADVIILTLLGATFITAEYGGMQVSNLNPDWVEIIARTRDPLRVGLIFPPGSRKTWDVRVTRMRTQLDSRTTFDESSNAWDQFAATFIWISIKSYDTTTPAVALPAGIATFLQVRIRATDQLTGGLDSLNLVATRRLRSWNKGMQQFDPAVDTRSPAWAFLDVLTGLGNARGIAPGDEINKILLDDLADWDTYTTTEGFAYDEVIDYSTSVFEALSKIASVGRAAVTNRDGKWGIIQEQLEGNAVQYFTPRNSWGFSVSKRFVDYPHALKVRFNSREDGWQEVERIVYDDGYNAGNATKFEVIELSGVTDPGHAWRIGRYTMASIRLRPEIFTFNTDVEHIICQRGDHILMAHDIPLWGTVYGRITDINGNTVTIDEAAVLDGMTSYRMRVRLDDGTSVIGDLTSQGGETFDHTFTPSIPAGVQVGDLVMVGEIGTETQELVVIAIEPGQELSARITCMEANDAIINADTGAIPPYTPQITLPADPSTVAPAAPYDVQASSENLQMQPDAASNVRPRITVSWSLVGDAAQRWKALKAQVRYREYDALYDGGTWNYIDVTNGFNSQATIPNVDIGLEYEIQVRVISPYDQPSSWSTPIFHTVGGATRTLVTVDGIVCTGIPGGVEIDVDYTNVVIRTGSYIEFAYGTINDRADAGTVLVQFPVPANLTTLTIISYVIPFDDTTERFFWARLVDAFGNISDWEPISSIAGVAATPLQATTDFYYIRPLNGTAIKNGTGTLTIEARLNNGGSDNLLSSGTIQLFDPLNQVLTVPNGYQVGSDGYTGVLDDTNINGDIIITLKDGPTGNPLDTIALVDIDDGGPGQDAIYAFISPTNGLAWSRDEGGVQSPVGNTTNLDVTFVIAGVEVARVSRQIEIQQSFGYGILLDNGAVAHSSGDLNATRVTTNVTTVNYTATVEYTYSFDGITASIAETVLSSRGALAFSRFYIKPTNGTAIRDGVGTLTVEARELTNGQDTLLSSGTIQLYDPSNQIVNVANGYQTGSDGYTGVLDATNISNDIVLTLKDGIAGLPLDSITLVDIADGADGAPGTDGSDAVAGFIEPTNGLSWSREGASGAWVPAGTTTELDCTFVQGGVEVARVSYRITLDQGDGTLTGSAIAHSGGDLNASRVTITPVGTGTRVMSVDFVYSFSGDVAAVSETVGTTRGGGTGLPGQFTSLRYDDLDTTQLAAGLGRYALLSNVLTNTSGVQNNFQNADGLLINMIDSDGANYRLIWSEIREGDRIVYRISPTRWFTYVVTDTEFQYVGTGAAQAVKFDISILDWEDPDPTVNQPSTSGNDVTFEIHKSSFDIAQQPIIDPDFDLSVALTGPTGTISDPQFEVFPGNQNFWVWARDTFAIGGTGSQEPYPTMALESNGVNGSNSVHWQEAVSGTEGTNNQFGQALYLYHAHRFRTNTPSFTVKVRARNLSSNGSFNLFFRMYGYASPRGGTPEDFTDQGDAFLSIPASTTTYQEYTLHLTSSATGTDAQFWNLRVSHDRTVGAGGFIASDLRECDIDSIFVSPDAAVFGTPTYVGSTDVPPGLVPSSNTVSDSGKYLRSDGTWGNPPGGAASNSFVDHIITDVDSGYTWGAPPRTVSAESGSDTLTWIEGSGIRLRADTTLDAIRIESRVPSGTVNRAMLYWDGPGQEWEQVDNIRISGRAVLEFYENTNDTRHASIDAAADYLRIGPSGAQPLNVLDVRFINWERITNDGSYYTAYRAAAEDDITSVTLGFADDYGQYWARLSDGAPMYTKADGTDLELGPSGSGASVGGKWSYDSTITAADPGAGNFRLNNANPSLATALYIADETETGVDFSTILNALDVGDQVFLQNLEDSNEALLVTISSKTDNVGWFNFGFTVNDNNGTSWTNGKEFGFILLLGVTAGNAVQISGTPVDNQVAVWTSASAIEGTTGLTWDGSAFQASGSGRFGSVNNYIDFDFATNNVNIEFGSLDDVVNFGASSNIERYTFNAPLNLLEIAPTANVAGHGALWMRGEVAGSVALHRDDTGADVVLGTHYEGDYRFSTTQTMADPGAGYFRLSGAIYGSNIAISKTDRLGNEPPFLKYLDVNDIIAIQHRTNDDKYAQYKVTSITDNTTWFQINTTTTPSGAFGGTFPVNNDQFAIKTSPLNLSTSVGAGTFFGSTLRWDTVESEWQETGALDLSSDDQVIFRQGGANRFVINPSATAVNMQMIGTGGSIILDPGQALNSKVVIGGGIGSGSVLQLSQHINNRPPGLTDTGTIYVYTTGSLVEPDLYYRAEAGTDYLIAGPNVGQVPAGTTDNALLKWDTATSKWVEETDARIADSGFLTFVGGSSSDGLDFGAAVAASTTDVSRHLDLYGGTYGIGITAGAMNFLVNSALKAQFTSTAIALNDTTTIDDGNAATPLVLRRSNATAAQVSIEFTATGAGITDTSRWLGNSANEPYWATSSNIGTGDKLWHEGDFTQSDINNWNAAGTGNVNSSGVPVDNQLAIWTNSNTIEGDADLTWNGSRLTVNGQAWFTGSSVEIQNQGELYLQDDDAVGGVDARTWSLRSVDNSFIIATTNDARSTKTSALILSRSGTNPTTALFSGMTLSIGTSSTTFARQTDDSLRLTTSSGYIDIGPKNSSYSHIYTDRANFYFNQGSFFQGPVRIQEQASADADVAAFHQFWTRNSNPTIAFMTDDTGVDYPIGYNSLPIAVISASQNFLLSQVGWLYHKSSGVAVTLTCAQDTNTWVGATWVVHNDDTEDLTIAQGSGVTVYWLEAGSAPAAGNVTVEQGGIVTVFKRNTNEFWVWGAKEAAGSGISSVAQDTSPQLGGTLDSNAFDIHMKDNDQIWFGTPTNGDGRLYSNGTDVYLDLSAGVDFRVRGNGGTENMLNCIVNGAVNLYFDNSLALYTTNRTLTGFTTAARVYHHNGSAYDVGLNRTPLVSNQNINPVAAQHCGATYVRTVTTAYSITLGSTSDFPTGGMFHIINAGASGNITVNDGSQALIYLDGSSATDVGASCTIGPGGMATLFKYTETTTDTWYIWGTGITA